MASKPTITQQPAAWMYRSEEYTHCFLYKADDGSIFKRQKGWDETPLYSEAAVAELQAEVERLREALEYYAENDHYDHGDVPGHIYVIDDHGRTARAALAQKERVMTSEIKPCPFCGTSMVVVTKDTFSHPGTVGDGKCLMAGKGYYWEHINWWNTRAGEPVAEIDE